MKKISIAIDGPASAGKSTVAKILANKMNYIYCDTGAMYRTLTFAAIDEGISLENQEELLKLLQQTSITFQNQEDGQHVILNHKTDVTDDIRQPKVTNAVSKVSAYKKVREELVRRQQEIAKEGGIVMDGRDIGTAVLPNAEVKIFLVASVEERAERRYQENLAKGIATDFDILKKEIEERDFLDSTRKESPLVQAEDAILVDTTGCNIEKVVEKIENIVKSALISTNY